MKIEAHETVEIEIILTREEAEWLKNYMQNGPEVEAQTDYDMRSKLFNGLKAKGI